MITKINKNYLNLNLGLCTQNKIIAKIIFKEKIVNNYINFLKKLFKLNFYFINQYKFLNLIYCLRFLRFLLNSINKIYCFNE